MPTRPLYKLGPVVLLLLTAALAHAQSPAAGGWPEPTQSARPWTRWWWHGSAVDEQNITRMLEEYHRAGLGGVEITCIYGVEGEEENDRRYRSDEWVSAVRHTIAEANRLGMGVDMPAGSGWRMGGPEMTRELGNSRLVLESHNVAGPAPFSLSFSRNQPQAVVARSADGTLVDLTKEIKAGKLEWDAPEGEWRIDVAAYRWAGDRVKRPGPGGEGININPYWRKSVDAFLDDFSKTVEQTPGIRAQFHDSFEYEGDWQPEFFAEFEKRRGYRLQEYLPQLAGEGNPELVGRVKADYRATLSDLVLQDLVQPWVAWSHKHDMLARNQSHGSPANWLDLYAACDIPETESFGRLFGGDANLLMMKFASSAANVAGKPLTSSETATWLDEHFHVTLSMVRQLVDRQILGGINHVFYHGTAYSPDRAKWPGWLFYASTQLNPQNPIWRDAPALNGYVMRCQSLLQASQHDNDVLLYWPLHDFWHSPRGLRADIRVHNFERWFKGHPFGDAAEQMHKQGYTFDYVSDRLLQGCTASGEGRITVGGGSYSAVVVPRTDHMPAETAEKLAELASAGCHILFVDDLPHSPPGLKGAAGDERFADEQARFATAVANLKDNAHVGDLADLLSQAKVRRETWAADAGLVFLRKARAGQALYFLNNSSKQAFDGWIAPAALGAHATLLDPSSGKIRQAAVRDADAGREVRVQLAPGESLFLQTARETTDAAPWPYVDAAGDPRTLDDAWQVEFITGGPKLPAAFETTGGPAWWTESDDPAAESFAGTARYTCRFDAPEGAESWDLNLGQVAGSVVVRLNGSQVAELIGPVYNVRLDSLRPTGNELAVEVTGVAANRIRDLDRRGVPWRVFKDINLVTIEYKKFDASGWPVLDLGLKGPVTLTPLK